MFKKFTKVLFIIAMFIQLVPSNIFANENENVFKSNYINLETKGEPTGVYDKAAVDIPEASYKLNVTVNVDGEEKEASTLAYGLSTNPEEVNVTALDGYVIESQKLDNVDYHQEMIVFDRENNIMSKELVVNVTTSPKAELPQELLSPMTNRSTFGWNNEEDAYFYLLKPGKDFNSDRGNDSYLYVGKGSINKYTKEIKSAPSINSINNTMIELTKGIENVKSRTFKGWNRIAIADGAVNKKGEQIASGNQYHVDGTFDVVTEKQVTVNFKVMNPNNEEISQDLKINSYLTDKNKEIDMPMNDDIKYYQYNQEKYDFDGWYTDDTYTNKVENNKYQIGNQSQTFYAKFVKAETKLNYTINFYKDNKLVEGDTISANEIVWNHQDTINVNIDQYKSKYNGEGYAFSRNDPIETDKIIQNGVINIYYVKDETKWTTVTFNNGTKGSLAGQDADGNVIFKDILKETTLAENNIKAPEITTNTNCEVADTPWNNGYAENKVINGETIFTAQYKKNINFTVYINDDFLPGNDRWAHLNKDTIGHDDKLAYTQAQIKDFANEYIGKKGYAKDTYKLVFKTKIEYLDNNKNKSWKDYDPETDKVLNEGFEVRYHVYIVKKFDVKFDLDNKENDVNYKVCNGSKLSDKQTVPTPSKKGYIFTGWKMNDNETLYDNDTINGMKFNDNTTFKAQYVKDEEQIRPAKLTVNYFIEGKKVTADSYEKTFTMWVNDADKAIKPAIDAKNDKYVGYKLDTEKTATIPTKISKDTEVKIYYVKDASKTKDAKLTVNYFIEGKKVTADS
ncbi:MAG: InlB B-repeat-containing protein, partial [Erysipelotrichaceae bacterium]